MRSATTASQDTHRTTRNGLGNCSSTTGSRRQSRKKTILKHFLKGFLKGKLIAPKLRKSADKSLSQPGCSHSNTIYDLQLQKTIVLRMQPRHEATLTQPLQCDLQPQLHKTRIELCTQEQPLVAEHRGNQSRPERPQPQPPHTQGTFHRRLRALYTEKYKVSCSGFLPKTKAHATFMQPFQCDLQPQLQATHRTTHTGTTTRCRTQRRNQSRPERPQPQPPHTRGTFHRRCSGFLPKTKPMQHSCSHSTPASSSQHRACNIHAAPVTTSLGHHFPSSPLPFVTTSLRSPHSLSHHFPCDVLL